MNDVASDKNAAHRDSFSAMVGIHVDVVDLNEVEIDGKNGLEKVLLY